MVLAGYARAIPETRPEIAVAARRLDKVMAYDTAE